MFGGSRRTDGRQNFLDQTSLIARAPFADRVVHAALAAEIEPAFAPSFAPEDYACRTGYGAHRAQLRLREHLKEHRFALHLDVRAYFPSIDVERLRGILAARIRDTAFLAVVDRVLDSGRGLYDASGVRAFARLAPDWPPPGRGLPIGALTSQLFAAHLYLNACDAFVKRTLKVPGYLRYVDDLFLFADTRAELRTARSAVAEWLASERGLRLKRPQAPILSCAGHLDALGLRIRREGFEAHPRALRRLRGAAARACFDRGGDARGRPWGEAWRASVASRVGHLLWG